MRVKICGITNLKDAEDALRLGADAVGFVFAKSPRQIYPIKAAEISRAVGPWISTVGVFVNEKTEIILRIAEKCKLSVIQLHGDEPPSQVERLAGYKVIKSFRVAKKGDLRAINRYDGEAILLDAKAEGVYGGTGRSFDWNLVKGKKFSRPFILSGGLSPTNVRRAVRLLSPYGVDVSSGVEKYPGKKDPRLMKEFIQNAKRI